MLCCFCLCLCGDKRICMSHKLVVIICPFRNSLSHNYQLWIEKPNVMFEFKTKHFLLISKFCGLCFFSHTSYSISRAYRVCNLIHIICLISLCVVCIIFSDELMYFKSMVGFLADLLLLLTPYVAHFVLLIETAVTHRKQIKFWKLLAVVDEQLEGLEWHRKQQDRRLTVKYINLLLLNTVLELYICWGIQDDQNWLRHFSISIPSFFVTRAGVLNYILYIDNIANRFRILNRKLEQTELTHHQLSDLKGIYSKLWHLTEMVNESFGLSQLVHMMHMFISTSCNLYWVYISPGFEDPTYPGKPKAFYHSTLLHENPFSN